MTSIELQAKGQQECSWLQDPHHPLSLMVEEKKHADPEQERQVVSADATAHDIVLARSSNAALSAPDFLQAK
ncbi:MAG: hypothetical protein ACRCR1_03900 [Aeromonas sp.]